MCRLFGREQRSANSRAVGDVDRERWRILDRQVPVDLSVGPEQLGLRYAGHCRGIVRIDGVVVDTLFRDGYANVRRDQGNRDRQNEQRY